jgi:hypothetical protein
MLCYCTFSNEQEGFEYWQAFSWIWDRFGFTLGCLFSRQNRMGVFSVPVDTHHYCFDFYLVCTCKYDGLLNKLKFKLQHHKILFSWFLLSGVVPSFVFTAILSSTSKLERQLKAIIITNLVEYYPKQFTVRHRVNRNWTL